MLAFCAFATICSAGAQWKPAGDKIKTDWAEKVDPRNVLPEYPRPGMERADWQNLNGEWEYAILPKGQAEPTSFDGNILVPFAVESSLSGVQKEVGEKNELWYKRTFTVPSSWKGKDILLNFGAVDWKADVFVNDILIGSHTGGFTPFSLNITPYLNGKSTHKLVVRVWDPSDKGYQPRGKQVANPEGIWYTPVTGIWQTVWLEPVASSHITSIKAIPNIDNGVMSVTVGACSDSPVSDIVEVSLLDKGQVVATAKGVQGTELRLAVQNPTLWEPSNPYLYDMKVSLSKNGKKVDEVKSYTAFRKISAERDANGIMRMRLNNKNLFQYGPLDQGWWPDGLYTAPTDEALLYDIVKTKAWGFNMIRKHVKVEPARWYYHCDKEGMLVWQDMPNGGELYKSTVVSLPLLGIGEISDGEANYARFGRANAEGRAQYYAELKEMVLQLYNCPCIAMWVPFNEGWGQFDAAKACDVILSLDDTRTIDHASGWHDQGIGDVKSLHVYFKRFDFAPDKLARPVVLSEFGGFNRRINGHCFNRRDFGYKRMKTDEALFEAFSALYEKEIAPAYAKGLSAAIYTQLSDVEDELNGLSTYDRAKEKLPPDKMRELFEKLFAPLE